MPAPTPAPALPAVPRDDTAPIVVALAASPQRLRRSHALTLVASSSEPASLTATARTAIRGVALRPVVVDVAPRRRVAIRLRLTRAGARRVRAALARGKRVVSTVTVTARDSAGNQSSRRLRIRITR